MSSSEFKSSTFFSRRVYWTAIPFLALALVVTTAIAGIPGIFLLIQAVGPDRTDAVMWSYGIIALSTIAAEGVFFLGGIWLVWRLMKRITSLTDEMQMLTRSVLHDISTPVAHISHQAERFDDPAADVKSVRDDIVASCASILKIVRTSAEISRTYEGLDRAGAEPVDFAAVVRDTYELYEAAAADKGVSLACALPDGPATMTAHAYRLRRLVGNLLDNALKFTPSGGRIEVSLGVESRGLRLRVADTGIGMTAEERSHAFERFYRADASRHTPGFGLGLTLVHAIVTFYGGTIAIESAPNCGTAFDLTLPRHA